MSGSAVVCVVSESAVYACVCVDVWSEVWRERRDRRWSVRRRRVLVSRVRAGRDRRAESSHD